METKTHTPWFDKWKQHFLSTTKFSDHELTEQPIAFLYFISGTENDPLASIDTLRKAENLPALYKEGIYDDTGAQTFILILNPTNNPKLADDATETVR